MKSFLRQTVEKAGSNVLHLTSSATVTSRVLKPFESIVQCITDGTNALYIVLPPPADVEGQIFDIAVVDFDTVSVYVCQHNTPTTAITGGDLDTDGDYITLYSNGFAYRTLAGNGS